jgi:2-methylcitrate dehydratase PrpD
MGAVDELADFISGTTFASLPSATVANVKMHVLDTVGAMLVGLRMTEGKAIRKLFRNIMPQGSRSKKGSLLRSIVISCSATRSTECDDIHIESCITPGSVIVPTALALVEAGYLSDGKGFIAAIATGYDVLIRFGLAFNGPEILRLGAWPTYLATPVGSAAVAAKALRLNQKQNVSALTTAFSLCSGTVIHPHGELSSRWLTIGVAAQGGIISAFAAQDGFTGSDSLPGETSGQFHGLQISPDKLTDRLGQRFLIDETGMKPYPVARQALAAVEAFREIVAANKIEAGSIEQILVQVPEPVMGIINRPELTENRLEAISSVQYEIALAATDPDNLFDLERKQIVQDEAVRLLMQKVHLESSPDLGPYYPSIWPARVEITAGGQKYNGEMFYPKGDYRNPLDWSELTTKFRRAALPTLGKLAIEEVISLVQNLDNITDLPRLAELIARA